MNSTRIIGIILIVGGLLGLAFGGFSFTKETHKASIGPIALAVEEKESVAIPVWFSAGAIVAGVLILAAGFRKS